MATNIFIAGHKGMVGSAITRKLSQNKNLNIITAAKSELNLLNQESVNRFMSNNNIDQIYVAAAKVGGILANNNFPADFIYENIIIQSNIINSAHNNNVNKILFLGSSCIYPKYAKQPIKEESILSGVLEETNEPYAVAKIAGIKMCESFNRQFNRDYRSAMPTNLYGENDNFHPNNSHVIPGLLQRFHEAKIKKDDLVEVWGSGNVLREFLYVEDAADACILVMNSDTELYKKVTTDTLSQINIGTGIDITIKELALLIKQVTNFKGKIVFNTNLPDGTPRKLLDISKICSLGWKPKYTLLQGLQKTYDWYVKNYNKKIKQ